MADFIQNTLDIRSANKKRIVGYLRKSAQAAKKDIAQALDLSFATVSNLGNTLIEDGFLEISAWQNSLGGRNTGLLSLNLHKHYYLGINIVNEGKVEIEVLNLRNEKVAADHSEVQDTGDPEMFAKNCARCVQRLLDKSGLRKQQLLGAGVALPGIINRPDGNLLNSTNAAWENKPILYALQQALNMPVYGENESNLLALASLRRHESEISDFIYLFIGHGLGIGIIANGRLVSGKRGLGGEINHFPIGFRNYRCHCGHRGCVETELSLPGFLRKYGQECGDDISYTDQAWNEFMTSVTLENGHALKVLHENGRLLGQLLSMLISVFEPQTIVIGGIVEDVFDKLYPDIIQELQSRMVLDVMKDIPVRKSSDYHELLLGGCGELVFGNWNP